MTDPNYAPAGLTIAEALASAQEQGYTQQFVARSNGTIEHADSHTTVHASDVAPEILWRIEGASDAADELMVLAIKTPDGGQGTLMLTYGPGASEEDSQVMEALDVRDAKPGLPPQA